MNVLGILLVLLAAVPAAQAGEAEDQAAALDMLYFYTVYDMDVEVWGVYNGYIGTKCSGSGIDNRCTFDEFVNFVVFGTADSKPSYYDLPSGYTVTPGDVLTITNFLRKGIKNWKFIFSNISPTRKSAVGVWSDLGFAVEKDKVVGGERNIDLSRHVKNAHMVLGAVSDHRASLLNPNVQKQLKTSVKDVIWQIANKEGASGYKWQQINWEETVRKNPDMANPKSDLFKAVTAELNTIFKDGDFAKTLTINNKVNTQLKGCFA